MFRLVRDKVTFFNLTENHHLVEGQRLFQQNENPGRKEQDGSGAEEEED